MNERTPNLDDLVSAHREGVRLTSEQHGITTHAAIRSRSTGVDGVPRIHVEFIDREWPL